MIVAGWCVYSDDSETKKVLDTALKLKDAGVDWFRTKLWAGGTRPERWVPGIGKDGVCTLEAISEIMPAGTEVQTPEHIEACRDLDYIWIGARNCNNFGLLMALSGWSKPIILKRGAGNTVKEMYNLVSILKEVIGVTGDIYVCERGITTFNRTEEIRFTADFSGMCEMMDLGLNVMFDVSHASFDKTKFKRLYDAAKAIGVEHFMFEVYENVDDATSDKQMAISIDELKEIIK